MKCALALTVERYTLAERAITSALVSAITSAVKKVIVMYPRSFFYQDRPNNNNINNNNNNNKLYFKRVHLANVIANLQWALQNIYTNSKYNMYISN